jgi:hypothetical protein
MNLPTVPTRIGGTSLVMWLTDALRPIGWRQVRTTILFGLVVLGFSYLIALLPVRQIMKTMPIPLYLAGDIIRFQIKAFVLLVAIAIANHAVDGGSRRRLTYTLAALAGCIAGGLLSEAFGMPWSKFVLPDAWPANRAYLRGTTGLLFMSAYNLLQWLLLGGTAVFLYADRRAAQQTEAHLRAGQFDRIRKSKIALESRLQAMQARVEPQFLFNTLSQVERLYEIDSAKAQLMLEDLTSYLRAAMPLMRSTSSTVAQEIELARAYLNIVKVRLGERLSFTIDFPDRLADARLPPMMLLPLIDHAIVHGIERSHAQGEIQITATLSDGHLRLLIVDTGAGFVPEDGTDSIASIRDRLNALYSAGASLVLQRRTAGATEAVLEIPYEEMPTPLTGPDAADY